MNDCIFCKIITGDSPGQVLYRDGQATAFRDVHPVAPTHVLIVPNQHITSVNDLVPQDEALAGHLFSVARKVAAQEGIDRSGYGAGCGIIVNTGLNAGQVVFHLHLHLIGGQRMRFPLG